MRGNTKRGFYTVEAAIVAPLVLLTIISLGYFIRVDGFWENCVHITAEECYVAASHGYGRDASPLSRNKVKRKVLAETPELESFRIRHYRAGYSENGIDKLTSFRLESSTHLALPLGFSRDLDFYGRIKFRAFAGKKDRAGPLGPDGLGEEIPEDPVWIFPAYGEKYHKENCTHVKATVHPELLTSSLKRRYAPCQLCHSENLPSGSLVYCFDGEDTAYHLGSCPSIKRRSVVIDRSEAIDRGYTPCSKCGG